MTRLALAALALSAATAAAAEEVKIDGETFGGLQARSIGPAVMSGRIAAIDAVPSDRLTLYVGSAGGGLWKSADGGIKFAPVFDKYSQSIGAVKVDAANPKTVWVGTGESWTRNSVSVGDGVYKSTDAGDSWTKVGLDQSERIARIAIDPKASDTVFVCAAGHLFDDHAERGVFRTKDGGKTWEKVLYVDAATGCGDLVIDPANSSVLYAGMWQFRRKPYFFTSGGPKSGLYKSTDGGSTWHKLAKGLPAGDLGRIALAASPAKAGLVYASVESKKDPKVAGSRDTALYRSEDAGESWTFMGNASAVTGRPFYFSHLVADPVEPNRIYKAGFGLSVSEDGGKTFSGLGSDGLMGGSFHGDTHAIWVNPKNVEQLILGTDGGVYFSHDRGAHWRFAPNLPVSQFYHVSYDMEWPYNVYGGLQDNLSWYGPSRSVGAIQNRHWQALSLGDGFWAFVDPTEPDIVYHEIQGGHLFRTRRSTLETKEIRPFPKEGEPELRFNWNTGLHVGASKALYVGAQFLYRSKDKGDSWERLSPDLTTNDKTKLQQHLSGGLTLDDSTAENHCTIFAIAESPKNPDVIWVGTDDGNLQLTKDGGKTWTNVAPAAPGLPKSTWVSSVEAGHFDAGTAYATFDGHMTGDMKSYVFGTSDYGKTWTALATPDVKGYAHVVREDLVNPKLLFVGTELGLFISVDGGRQWGQFTGGIPNVAVRDAVIHPREGDLILATHGRGIYILDDLTPLRQLTPQVAERDVAFLESRPSIALVPALDPSTAFASDVEFNGETPAEAAVITYYLKKRHVFGDLKLEIYDASGSLVSTLQGGKRRGINRVEWPMRLKAPRMPPGENLVPSFFSLLGPRVPYGTYSVKMIKGKDTFTSEVKLVADPRSKHSDQDRAQQQETVRKLYALCERLGDSVTSLVATRDAARSRAEGLPKEDALGRRLTAYADSLEAERKLLVSTAQGEGISSAEMLREQVGGLYGAVNGYEGRPGDGQVQRLALLTRNVEAARVRVQAAIAKDGPGLDLELAKRKLPALQLPEAH